MSDRIEQALDQYRDVRDEMYERMFKTIYESPWLAAAVGLEPASLGRRGPQSATWEQDELKRLKRQEIESHMEHGTLLDAWARLLLYVRPEEKLVDERHFNMVRRRIEVLTRELVQELPGVKA